MSKTHVLRIKKEYFNQLNSGKKTLEIRVGYKQIRTIRKNDYVSFENYGKNIFFVTRLSKYDSFVEMLNSESVESVLPGFSMTNALLTLKEIYPQEKEQLGIYVIELKKVDGEVKNDNPVKGKLIRASQLLEKGNRKLFSSFLSITYNATDWVCDDYPKHFSWFWNKTVPEIFSNNREIIAYYIGSSIAGVAILKKDETESKICTFFVDEKFRRQGIGTILLQESFKFLGTSKPLITFADYKIDLFKKIIDKYDWQLTQTLDTGYYNNSAKEYVYNGKIE